MDLLYNLLLLCVPYLFDCKTGLVNFFFIISHGLHLRVAYSAFLYYRQV